LTGQAGLVISSGQTTLGNASTSALTIAGATYIGGHTTLTTASSTGLSVSGGTYLSSGVQVSGSASDINGGIVSINNSSNFTTNINTGTSNGAVNIGNSAAGALTLVSGNTVSITSGTTNAISIDSGTTGLVNIGTGNNAKTLNIGTGTAGNTLNIATNNTTADTVNIGSALDTINLAGLISQTYTGTGVGHTISANSLTTGNALYIQSTATALAGALAKIENTASTLTTNTGDILRLGYTGIHAANGTTLNLTTAQTGATALVLRINDDGTYTDSTPVVVDGGGNVGIGTSTPRASLHNTGATILGSVTLANIASSGTIGSAASTVDLYTAFNINQTTANITLNLPSPTNTTPGRIAIVNNIGTREFIMSNERVQVNKGRQYMWNGTAWSEVGDSTGEKYISKIKSANQTVSTTTYVNDADLRFDIGANETWYFVADLSINGTTAGDLKLTASAPAGATCSIGYTDPEGATSQDNMSCGATPTALIPTNAVYDKYTVSGTVINGGTAGSVIIQWAQWLVSGNLILAQGSSIIAYRISGADLAEVYYADDSDIKEGEIVSLTGKGLSQVEKTSRKYDNNTIGIVSTKPGLVIGEADGRGKPVVVGLSGRVPVKVTTKNGDIKPGDYIASSDIPGIGMKATEAGQVIGKALTGLSGTDIEGSIVVFIQNTYFDGFYIDEHKIGEVGSETAYSSTTQTAYKTTLPDGSLADRFTHMIRLTIEKLTDVFIKTRLWVKSLRTEKVETNILCIEDVCINKDQFKRILEETKTSTSIQNATPAQVEDSTSIQTEGGTNQPVSDTDTSGSQVSGDVSIPGMGNGIDAVAEYVEDSENAEQLSDSVVNTPSPLAQESQDTDNTQTSLELTPEGTAALVPVQ
jgi:hypothetical protein